MTSNRRPGKGRRSRGTGRLPGSSSPTHQWRQLRDRRPERLGRQPGDVLRRFADAYLAPVLQALALPVTAVGADAKKKPKPLVVLTAADLPVALLALSDMPTGWAAAAADALLRKRYAASGTARVSRTAWRRASSPPPTRGLAVETPLDELDDAMDDVGVSRRLAMVGSVQLEQLSAGKLRGQGASIVDGHTLVVEGADQQEIDIELRQLRPDVVLGPVGRCRLPVVAAVAPAVHHADRMVKRQSARGWRGSSRKV